MDPRFSDSDWSKIGEVFDAALSLAQEDRPDFVRKAADGNAEIIAEIARLLASDAGTSGFLDSPVPADLL